MNRSIKIEYKSEIDKQGIEVLYHIKILPKDKKIHWGFHPTLPEGMHWKAGDNLGGLGFDHHTDSQSFEDFISKPTHEIHKKKYLEVVRLIKEQA